MKNALVILVCFILPIVGGLWFMRKKRNVWISFLVGMAAFVISQILIRLPLLQLMQSELSVQFYFMKHPIFMILCLAFTAGLFEECARWIGCTCIKKKHDSLYDAIAFGFGHGGVEAMLLIAPTLLMNQVSMLNVFISMFERCVAIGIHVALTILVWHGVHEKKLWWLMLAILLHTGMDSASFISNNVYIIEGYAFIYTILVWCLCYKMIIKKVIGGETG